MMEPKRRNQAACGRAHSATDHWFATAACKFAVWIPGGMAIELEEGAEEDFFFDGR